MRFPLGESEAASLTAPPCVVPPAIAVEATNGLQNGLELYVIEGVLPCVKTTPRILPWQTKHLPASVEFIDEPRNLICSSATHPI